MRAIAILLWVAAAAAGQVFEVASIKPGDPLATEQGWSETTGGFKVSNMPLRELIMYAHGVLEYQVTGGPKWVDTDGFTILAKLEGPAQKPGNDPEGDPRLRAAMRALLADRFHLAVHSETKEMPAYTLVTARTGFKLKKAEPAESSGSTFGGGSARFRNTSMPDFAEVLSHLLMRPVVDRSGIDGGYDFQLTWAPEDRPDAIGPSLFTAVQEQLGLRLESRKVQVKMIVIDRAEKPTEN
jgi:uncharacterized protein (TIGR03435 family)